MSDTTFTPNSDTTPEPGASSAAKGHFAKAVEEARAGARALGKEAQDRADAYRGKANQASSEFVQEARVRSEDARIKANELAEEGKIKAASLAQDGKAGASRAISSLSKMVDENAPLIDEKLGVTYGDYARTAAKSMQDAATRLDQKDFAELGDDAREFVRKSPGVAVGIAAVAGFMLARLFGGSKN